MKRLGLFTGKIYEENVDTSTITECCVAGEEFSETDVFIYKLRCQQCPGGCPNKP